MTPTQLSTRIYKLPVIFQSSNNNEPSQDGVYLYDRPTVSNMLSMCVIYVCDIKILANQVSW